MSFPRAGEVWKRGDVIVKVRIIKLSGALVVFLVGEDTGSFLSWNWFDDARRIG